MKTPVIAAVEALGAGRLRLRWKSGVVVEIDLAADIARLSALAALRDADVFAHARVGEWGHSVEWPGGVDIGSDSLWRDTLLATDHADAVALNDWRMAHGLTQAQAAEALGLSRRMVVYYESGEKPVPKTVQLACVGWETQQARAA